MRYVLLYDFLGLDQFGRPMLVERIGAWNLELVHSHSQDLDKFLALCKAEWDDCQKKWQQDMLALDHQVRSGRQDDLPSKTPAKMAAAEEEVNKAEEDMRPIDDAEDAVFREDQGPEDQQQPCGAEEDEERSFAIELQIVAEEEVMSKQTSGSVENRFEAEKRKLSAQLLADYSQEVLERKHVVHSFLSKHGFARVNSCKRSLLSSTYPLHKAAELADEQVARMLLQEGARPAQKNFSGKTAAQVAAKKNKDGSHDKVLAVLSEAISNSSGKAGGGADFSAFSSAS